MHIVKKETNGEVISFPKGQENADIIKLLFIGDNVSHVHNTIKLFYFLLSEERK